MWKVLDKVLGRVANAVVAEQDKQARKAEKAREKEAKRAEAKARWGGS